MLRFFGASDDLAECRGDVEGEIGCFDCEVEVRIGEPDGGCYVLISYEHGIPCPCWAVSVVQLDEGVPIPWPIRVGTIDRVNEVFGGVGYSACAEVDCPPGTPVFWRRKGEGEAWQVPS